jgi:prevent-host-death family protein
MKRSAASSQLRQFWWLAAFLASHNSPERSFHETWPCPKPRQLRLHRSVFGLIERDRCFHLTFDQRWAIITLVKLVKEPAMPHAQWNIADAKSKLSEVLNRAEEEVQIITRRNHQYVVLDGATYQRLTGSVPTLKELILSGPSLEGVDLERDASPGRELDL